MVVSRTVGGFFVIDTIELDLATGLFIFLPPVSTPPFPNIPAAAVLPFCILAALLPAIDEAGGAKVCPVGDTKDIGVVAGTFNCLAFSRLSRASLFRCSFRLAASISFFVLASGASAGGIDVSVVGIAPVALFVGGFAGIGIVKGGGLTVLAGLAPPPAAAN